VAALVPKTSLICLHIWLQYSVYTSVTNIHTTHKPERGNHFRFKIVGVQKVIVIILITKVIHLACHK